MSSRPILSLLILLAGACGGDPGGGETATPREPADERVPIEEGMLTVRNVSGSTETPQEIAVLGGEEIEYELGFGVTGMLHVELWDRRGAKAGPHTRKFDFSQMRVEAGERRRLLFFHRILRGPEILREFVAPIGGEPAVRALKSVAPQFETEGVVPCRLRLRRPGETGGVTTSVRITGEAVPVGGGFRVSGSGVPPEGATVEPGEELLLHFWAWPGPTGSFSFPAGTDGEEVLLDGRRYDGSEVPGPYWTLRVTFEAE